MFVDGVPTGLSSSAGSTISNTNPNILRIGAANTGGNFAWFLTGDVAEVLLFPTALSAADRQAVEAYLTAKWKAGGLSSSILPTSTALSLTNLGTLDVNGVNQTVASLADVVAGSGGTITNSATAKPVTFTIDGAAGTTTFSGVIQNGTSAVSLVKNGASTQVLAGANTYSGTTTVSGGVLRVQHATALGSTAGGTTVTGGALELQHATGIAVGSETLGLSGSGVGGAGALRSVSGANSWAGNITLNSAAEIQTDAGSLSISGNILNGGHLLTFDSIASTTVSGTISGAGGLAKTGAGILVLSNAHTYNGTTAVNNGTLLVNGTHTGGGNYTVAAGATLGGSGSIASLVTGAGLGSPGNSPGIFSVLQTDPSAGIDFAFEFTQPGDPNWGTPSASGNDVWRSTHASNPFAGGTLDSDNIIRIYFDDVAAGDVFRGGLFTDFNSDFSTAVAGAAFEYFVLGDGFGSDAVFNGANYYSLTNFDPLLLPDMSVVQTSAPFGGGNGWVMQFEVIATPEPSSTALWLLLGLVGTAAGLRRRRAKA
jgi:autotransporter-associated beta strand protein